MTFNSISESNDAGNAVCSAEQLVPVNSSRKTDWKTLPEKRLHVSRRILAFPCTRTRGIRSLRLWV